MATIVLNEPIDFPIATMRALLKEHQPQYRWQCGECDEGGAADKVVFDRTQLIFGRSAADIIMVNATPCGGTFYGQPGEVPLHRHHVLISDPTTDDPHLANRLQILLCTALTHHSGDASIRCQLQAGGPWLDAAGLREAMQIVSGGISLASLDAVNVAWPIQQDRRSPSALAGLPSLILLLDDPLHFDWSEISDLAVELDPGGNWQVNFEPDGLGFLLGRGGMVALTYPDTPLHADLLAQALARSPRFAGDRDRIIAHHSQLIISASVEPDAAFADKHAFALIMSLIACIAAHAKGVVGLYNTNIRTVHDPAAVAAHLPKIAEREIAIDLWTSCNWHGVEDGDVSLSTCGFAAFLGYELEVWHAPAPTSLVEEKIGGLMVNLLAQGPVIGEGDSIGMTDDGCPIVCNFADSRSERPVPTRALILAFDQPAIAREPSIDPRSFGRKGL